MARFLRMTRQARWLRHPDLSWLLEHEIQGDALRDLQTEDNKLSVYKVQDKGDAERIVLALAANRDNLANLDYALFEDTMLNSIDITFAPQIGQTPDDEVNKLHYNLTNLTVERLAKLAAVVAAGQHTRIPRKEIGSRLHQAIRAGTLDGNRLKPNLLAKVG